MARKPSLSIESLEALGAARLAALIAEEASGNTAFKRRVMTALAGQSGAEAVAKLIDRRLAGMARAFVDWDKERAFRDDLAALVARSIGSTKHLVGGRGSLLADADTCVRRSPRRTDHL